MRVHGSPCRLPGVPLQRNEVHHELREGEEPEEQARHQRRRRAAEAPEPEEGGQADVLQPPEVPQHPLHQDGEARRSLRVNVAIHPSQNTVINHFRKIN